MSMDKHVIEEFLHGQVECWNNGDKEGFFAHYRQVAPNGLSIEYVGKPQHDAWLTLEGMWAQQQPKIRIDVRQCIVNANEAACQHLNAFREQDGGIDTIETYRFEDGKLFVRYFINM
ncbi:MULTISPECIES: nuclear transport factor 2 family protein [Pseudomonas]|uniref:nuclear transport factor 2 family protein n=1 Tax=Pseudomonas TaxID=286 RepID=UPI0008E435A7|nr:MULTISPECIES: nuclear transport factor 2 family protein [Pseudomonas]SFT81796.1 hypothetical protein SAMN05216264_104290 [Pseudomonas marincola]